MTTYSVHSSAFHGGRLLSSHVTLAAAYRAARKAAGSCWGRNRGWAGRVPASCCCGGPVIRPDDGGHVEKWSADGQSGCVHWGSDGQQVAVA